MKTYVKKPIPVKAIQYVSGGEDKIISFCGNNGSFKNAHHPVMVIKNESGDSIAANGDYVICGVKGEFYSCPKDVFESSYLEVDT